MREMVGARETAVIQSVKISNQAFSFLLVTYKDNRPQENQSEQQENPEDRFLLGPSNAMSDLINKATEEWKNESKESPISYDMKLKFRWTNDEPCGETDDFLKSDLIGRHDFFCLLESPSVPELGTLVEKINEKLKKHEEIHTKELMGVPCIAVDFFLDRRYFVGNKKAWFEEGDSNAIMLDPTRIHALMFVDVKKGLRDNDRKLTLLDFLDFLAYPRTESKASPQCLPEETRTSIKGFFLGYGIFELIFLLESSGLEDLFVSVANIRQCFRKKLNNSKDLILARGTSTMVFMPQRTMMKDIKPEVKLINYSIIVATETGKELDVCRDIMNLGRDEGIKIDVFDRQGYYDLIVGFEEASFPNACKIIECISRLSGVLSTFTIIKLDEMRIAEKVLGDDRNEKKSS